MACGATRRRTIRPLAIQNEKPRNLALVARVTLLLVSLTQAGVGKEEADLYAEGLRRGGAVVSARVADADASRLQAVMDRSAVKVADRSAAYRKAGWTSFDPGATPYSSEQVRRERELYR